MLIVFIEASTWASNYATHTVCVTADITFLTMKLGSQGAEEALDSSNDFRFLATRGIRERRKGVACEKIRMSRNKSFYSSRTNETNAWAGRSAREKGNAI